MMPPKLALSALLAFAACAPTLPPTRSLTASHKKVAVADDTLADTETAADLYVYDPKGKRDPFQNPNQGASGTRYIHDVALESRPLQALQKFDLDQLVLKMTMTGTAAPQALIQDPTGKAHLVRLGDFVGRDWGMVSHIGQEDLTITETIADQQTGTVSHEYLHLKMPKTAAEEVADHAISNERVVGSPAP